MPSRTTELRPICRSGAPARKLRRRDLRLLEKVDRTSRVLELQAHAGALPVGCDRRACEEREIETRLPGAAVEVEPLGPRLDALGNVGDLVKTIHRAQNVAGVGICPGSIPFGIVPR